jgi:hypothetical protein
MIHWAWAVGALFGGVVAGFLIMCLLAVGASEHSWRCGYNEGHEDGFQDGIKQFDKVG